MGEAIQNLREPEGQKTLEGLVGPQLSNITLVSLAVKLLMNRFGITYQQARGRFTCSLKPHLINDPIIKSSIESSGEKRTWYFVKQGEEPRVLERIEQIVAERKTRKQGKKERNSDLIISFSSVLGEVLINEFGYEKGEKLRGKISYLRPELLGDEEVLDCIDISGEEGYSIRYHVKRDQRERLRERMKFLLSLPRPTRQRREESESPKEPQVSFSSLLADILISDFDYEKGSRLTTRIIYIRPRLVEDKQVLECIEIHGEGVGRRYKIIKGHEEKLKERVKLLLSQPTQRSSKPKLINVQRTSLVSLLSQVIKEQNSEITESRSKSRAGYYLPVIAEDEQIREGIEVTQAERTYRTVKLGYEEKLKERARVLLQERAKRSVRRVHAQELYRPRRDGKYSFHAAVVNTLRRAHGLSEELAAQTYFRVKDRVLADKKVQECLDVVGKGRSTRHWVRKGQGKDINERLIGLLDAPGKSFTSIAKKVIMEEYGYTSEEDPDFSLTFSQVRVDYYGSSQLKKHFVEIKDGVWRLIDAEGLEKTLRKLIIKEIKEREAKIRTIAARASDSDGSYVDEARQKAGRTKYISFTKVLAEVMAEEWGIPRKEAINRMSLLRPELVEYEDVQECIVIENEGQGRRTRYKVKPEKVDELKEIVRDWITRSDDEDEEDILEDPTDGRVFTLMDISQRGKIDFGKLREYLSETKYREILGDVVRGRREGVVVAGYEEENVRRFIETVRSDDEK